MHVIVLLVEVQQNKERRLTEWLTDSTGRPAERWLSEYSNNTSNNHYFPGDWVTHDNNIVRDVCTSSMILLLITADDDGDVINTHYVESLLTVIDGNTITVNYL